MRIAISGTHITGKSTLAAALAERLPGHTVVPEPYELLAGRGYEFADPPEIEDYVIQLRQSLIGLRRAAPNRIFDRCPLDLLGYITVSPGGERFDLEAWREPIARAVQSLDLIVFVHADPRYDRAIAPEDVAFRLAADDALHDIINSDDLDLCDGVDVLTLDGPWDRRVDTVLAHIADLPSSWPLSPRA